jgi:hypothetical protein
VKYTDGLYHVEFLAYELWGIVTVWGEFCISCDLKPVSFSSKEEAEEYCAKMNICPEGATCRNLC